MKLTKMADGRTLLETPGAAPIALFDAEVRDLARALAPRLNVRGVERIGSGVGLRIGDGDYDVIHLCFTDEAHELGEQIRQMGMGQ